MTSADAPRDAGRRTAPEPSGPQPSGSEACAPFDVRASDDGAPTLFSARYGQTYGSLHGALVEARHVFLDGAGVAARLAASLPTRVLEVGFGTGLNVAATVDAAVRTGTTLAVVSLEHDLLPADAFRALGYGERLGLDGYDDALAAWRQALPSVPAHPATFAYGPATVTVVPGDACAGRVDAFGPFDAVYLDAFSPDVNPELWTEAFLARLHDALAPGGRLATYCVQGRVRRALAAAGFVVEKRPGPPGKREVLAATRPA